MTENSTKSKSISERLRQEILSGKFDVTRKLPSEHQLMRRFAVARETVRAALKELLDKKLVERRPGYGTFLADLAARSPIASMTGLAHGSVMLKWVFAHKSVDARVIFPHESVSCHLRHAQ